MFAILISVIFALMTGFGIVTFVMGLKLHRSNNIGDDKSGPFNYRYASSPKFKMSYEQCSLQECESAARRFDVVFHSNRVSSADNAMLKAFDTTEGKTAGSFKKDTSPSYADDQYNFNDLQPVDKPLFKPKDQ